MSGARHQRESLAAIETQATPALDRKGQGTCLVHGLTFRPRGGRRDGPHRARRLAPEEVSVLAPLA